MKCFSFKVFVAAAFLHVAGTTWLVSEAISRIHAYGDGETFPWLTSLSWIWMPVPLLLNYHFQAGPAHYFYYLALPWSLVVALCCGFFVPYFRRWRYRLA
jgi:hypothetical protein